MHVFKCYDNSKNIEVTKGKNKENIKKRREIRENTGTEDKCTDAFIQHITYSSCFERVFLYYSKGPYPVSLIHVRVMSES